MLSKRNCCFKSRLISLVVWLIVGAVENISDRMDSQVLVFSFALIGFGLSILGTWGTSLWYTLRLDESIITAQFYLCVVLASGFFVISSILLLIEFDRGKSGPFLILGGLLVPSGMIFGNFPSPLILFGSPFWILEGGIEGIRLPFFYPTILIFQIFFMYPWNVIIDYNILICALYILFKRNLIGRDVIFVICNVVVVFSLIFASYTVYLLAFSYPVMSQTAILFPLLPVGLLQMVRE